MTTPDEDLQALFRRHRDQLSHAPPAGLERRVREALPAEVRPRSRRSIWAGFLSAALAAVVTLLSVETLSARGNERDRLEQEVLSSHVRSLMVDHLFDVESGDQHTVKPWFEGKLDFAPTVRDFASEGFPLLGGRLDYLSGRPVAALAYRSNRHVINVFEWPAGDAKRQEPALVTRRGYQLVSWQSGAMMYFAVSDLNAVELTAFVRLWE